MHRKAICQIAYKRASCSLYIHQFKVDEPIGSKALNLRKDRIYGSRYKRYALIGAIVMETLDLIVEPRSLQIYPNPRSKLPMAEIE